MIAFGEGAGRGCRAAYAGSMARRRHALLVLSVLLAGCGGGQAERDRHAGPRPSAADIAVIRGWGADMQHGETKRASARFGLPAVVANNTPELELRTRAEVEFFNGTLPCGGRLVASELRGELIVATFELTDRPGGGCGSGIGHRAQAAFGLRDGKIVRWIRVPNRPSIDGAGGELV
jgi:hypothetical protein